MKKVKVGIVVGSLRKDSYNRSTAKALMALLPENFEAEIIEIGQLPLYNQDFDDFDTVPASWTAFRAQAAAKDAYIFFTPEYNRSIPAVLKNAIDIGSRPFGSNLWGGKPAAIVSVSVGKPGGFGANHHLRQVATVLDMYTMQQPEAYIGGINEMLDENGNANEGLQKFLQVIADAFVKWTGNFIDLA